jgi:two-component system, NarL family, sensor kinase
MIDPAAHQIVVTPHGAPFRLRRGVVLTFAGLVLAACVVAAALLLSKARNERQAIRDHALSMAVTLSFGFDQEVTAGNALLRGLSSSPALKAGDVKGFYDQLKATAIPGGSWLILQDLDGQVVNTLRPFGATLPRHRDFPTYPDALNRVRERGWTVSGRMASLVKPGTTVIALSLRIDHDDCAMKGFITTILSQDRLGTILEQQKVPGGWMKGLYDRKLQPIVTSRGPETSSHIPVPDAVAARLAGGNPTATAEGLLEGIDERGIPVLVAYRSSGATNWTAVVEVPLAFVNAPVTGVLRQMAVPAALLVLAGGLAALFTARQVERPLRTLSHLVSKAQGEVTQLSEQLLALQEEERQRIARELHDSTAQSLVAANLGLARLEREVEQGPAARKLVAQIEVLLDRALQELRVFTYLLHPPNLAEDGLKATLEEFIDGFAGRTGCGRGSGFPAGSTTPRRRSSAPFFGWCRRRWPTFIAMPGPQRFRSMRNWQAGKSSCESVTTAGASVNLRATSRSAGPGWASASQACAPGCGSSTAT